MCHCCLQNHNNFKDAIVCGKFLERFSLEPSLMFKSDKSKLMARNIKKKIKFGLAVDNVPLLKLLIRMGNS